MKEKTNLIALVYDLSNINIEKTISLRNSSFVLTLVLCSHVKMPNGTLDSFFGVKRKASDEPTNEQSVSKAAKSDSNGTPKKVRDAWRSEWNKSFPWIEKVQCDGQTKAICLWCKNSGKTNSMATTGSCNLQSSTFSRHESSRDHLMATEAHRAKQKRTAINQVI